MNKLSTFYIWKTFCKKNKLICVTLSFLSLTYPIESILTPIFFAYIIKNIGVDIKLVIKGIICLSILYIISMGLYNIDIYASQDLEINMQNHIINETLTQLFEINKYNIETFNNGELLTNIKLFSRVMTSYINTLRNNIVPNILSLTFQSIYLLTIDPFLSSLLTIMTVFIISLLYLSPNFYNNDITDAINSDSNLYENIDEILINFPTIINHNGFKRELKNLSNNGEKYKKLQKKAVLNSMKISSLMNSIICLISFIFIYRLYKNIISNPLLDTKIKVSKTTASITILLETMNIGKHMIFVLYDIMYEKSCLTSLQKNLQDTQDKIVINKQNINEHYSDSIIKIENLTFGYNKSKPNIQNINLDFKKGSITSIQGKNGTGKSTLLKLLMQYILPNSGNIYFNNKPYFLYKPEEIRSLIGYATQNCVLFDRSIAENILYAKPDMTIDELQNKINKIGLLDFFLQFKDGIHTQVGKQGNKVSGGQRQIIQLIRILIQDPDVILLDEITSAVDEKYVDYIINLIKTHLKGKTIIIVSHDKKLINIADQIINM